MRSRSNQNVETCVRNIHLKGANVVISAMHVQ